MVPNGLSGNVYDAITVISAMQLGDERKDQDRARWFDPGQIACVCDGVTSSFRAREGAELGVSIAPILFNGPVKERLGFLCELLMAYRQQCQGSREIICFPAGSPPALNDLLRRVIQEKQSISYQTTLIAARFQTEEKAVIAQIIKCGDSALLAFSPEGEPLASTLALSKDRHPRLANLKNDKPALSTRTISFGPGDELLVRVEGQPTRQQVEQAGIQTQHVSQWLICTPIDGGPKEGGSGTTNPITRHTLLLTPSDILLVPKFLYGMQLSSSDGRNYRILNYSSTIRILHNFSSELHSLASAGSITMVLPDHFYSGGYDHYEDRYPAGTHFVLCSDGFYRSFTSSNELWAWLQKNLAALQEAKDQETVLTQLHQRLHKLGGDDDISFVWVFPKKTPAKQGQAEKTEY